MKALILKITCLLVSHDPLDTLSWADQFMVMQQGRIIQQGSEGRSMFIIMVRSFLSKRSTGSKRRSR